MTTLISKADAARFKAQQRAAKGDWWVYILALENDKYAVGHSANLSQHIHDHWRGKGSAWCKKHRPIRVVDVIRTTEANALGLEEAITIEYKLKYGFNSTRGGQDNNPKEHAAPHWWVEEPDKEPGAFIETEDPAP